MRFKLRDSFETHLWRPEVCSVAADKAHKLSLRMYEIRECEGSNICHLLRTTLTCIEMKDQQPLNSQNSNCGANHDPNLG